MHDDQSALRAVEKALAFAHAALEEPTPHRVMLAKRYAAQALPQLAGPARPHSSPAEARRLLESAGQLRALLAVVERTQDHSQQAHN